MISGKQYKERMAKLKSNVYQQGKLVGTLIRVL